MGDQIYKVCVPIFNVATICTHIFKCYLVRCGSKEQPPQRHMFRDFGLHAQNILGSIISVQGNLYDHLMSFSIFTLIMNKIFIRAPKKWRQAQFGFASHLTQIACFISYKMWVQREKHLNKTHPSSILVRCDELFISVPLFIENLHQIAVKILKMHRRGLFNRLTWHNKLGSN